MADTNSILWQMADQIRARLGNADLYATKVSLATAVSEQIADTISDINNRMAVLEGGGGTQVPNLTSQPVTWTNLSEVNLSGEKLTNGIFDLPTTYEVGSRLIVTSAFNTYSVGDELELVQINANAPSYKLKDSSGAFTWAGASLAEANTDLTGPINGWTVHSGTLDQSKLAEGIIKGSGSSVVIQQMFPQSIASGTKLVIKATRTDTNTGSIRVKLLRANETPYWQDLLDPADGFAEFETTETTYGIGIETIHAAREVSELSVFQGDKSGGTVQATTNTLQRISGTEGWNAGASSSQAIPGGQDGYFQFQYDGGSVRVGLTYQDVDFDEPTPQGYRLGLHGDGTVISDGYNSGADFALSGTWLRIRHYSGDNLIKFQKLQTVYDQLPNYTLPATPTGSHANNHTFEAEARPLVIALQTTSGMTEGELYRMHVYNVSSGNAQLYELDGTQVGWVGSSRGNDWEVVEEAGQDYVTFHTATPLTTNSPLYLDTSLFHNGSSQINDATLVS